MSHRFLLWHKSLLPVITGLAFFVLASKDLALALNEMGNPYSLVLWPTLVFEVGVGWLALIYLKSWNSASIKKRAILGVLVIMTALGLFVAQRFTNSSMRDALAALLTSVTGIYFMLVGLLMYRDYFSSLSHNQ